MTRSPEPKRHLPAGLRAQLDAQSYVGPATFGMRPLLTEPEQLDEWQPDVAVVGAPWDDNTTNRPGARFGPRAIRADAYDPGTYHLDLGIEMFDHLEVVDYGDAVTSHGMWELSKKAVYDRVNEVASRGIIPFIIGGDHSITWPAATAVAEHHGFGNVVMIHFDAHADTGEHSRGQPRQPRHADATADRVGCDSRAELHPGRPARLLAGRGRPEVDARQRPDPLHDAGGLGARRSAGDGRRHRRGKGEGRQGLHLYRHRCARSGIRAGDRHAGPGGFAPIDLLRFVRQIVLETDVVAFDITEVSPPYDHADITVNNAHGLIWEALAALAYKKRASGQRR